MEHNLKYKISVLLAIVGVITNRHKHKIINKMIPIGNHILIQPAPPEEITKNGIILPKKRKQAYGEVVAISADAEHEVSVGDQVAYEPNAGTLLESGLLCLTDEHIMYKICK